MGYTTDFEGQIEIDPPLNEAEVMYINKFSDTRRMHREKGPYYLGTGMCGQDHESDIIDFNSPDPEQPGLWCQWEITEDGKYLQWDGGEKFYRADKWLEYVLEHFIVGEPIAKQRYPEIGGFLTGGHTANGVIDAQGEEPDDMWRMVVTNGKVKVQQGTVSYEDPPSTVEQIGMDFVKAIGKM